jgi:peroxiredoxin (alkyl hydroperoxide reductase subunit C)
MSTPNPASPASGAAALPLVSRPAPDFSAQALLGRDFRSVRLKDFAGRWVLLLFYPLDFTFVCPTELVALNDHLADFAARGCEVLACSTDSVYCHLGWVKSDARLASLGYPLLSDLTKEIAARYGVLVPELGVALRGTFLIDDRGILRWQSIHDLNAGRSVAEMLRVLDALQTEKPCPCDWQKGQPTLAE